MNTARITDPRVGIGEDRPVAVTQIAANFICARRAASRGEIRCRPRPTPTITSTPSTDKHAAPADKIADHAGERRAEQIAGHGARQRAADRDLPLAAPARDRRSAPSATGNTPPAPMPARMRVTNSIGKTVQSAPTKVGDRRAAPDTRASAAPCRTGRRAAPIIGCTMA